MVATVLALAVATAMPPQAVVELKRVPRLVGVADVRIWRSLLPERMVYGGRGRPVLLRARTAAARDTLRRLGLDVSVAAWQALQLDSSAMLSVLESGAAVDVRSSPAHRPLAMRAGVDTGVFRVHRGEGVSHGRTGRGVLLGIVDTGIDLSHRAFRRPDGTHRVVAFWYQDAVTGTPPAGFGYGAWCGREDIAAERCALSDQVGHGTHVVGIAAGGAPVFGAAPEADIAVVRSDTFTRLADAVAFLVGVAERRGQPVVINISVGGHYGPHDGRTPLEGYIARLAGPGRLLVAAAGNDGADSMHVHVSLTEGPQRVLLADLPPVGADVDVILELWTDFSSSEALSLDLELWRGDALGVAMPLVADGNDLLAGTLRDGDNPLAEVAYAVDYVSEHRLVRHEVVIDRRASRDLAPGNDLVLNLRGAGEVDGWISASDYRHGVARFGTATAKGWVSGDNRMSITVPATSSRVVAVGSSAVRVRWQAENGESESIPGLRNGMLAPYSSIGPTRDPAWTGVKPDICAPGTIIFSARAMGHHYPDRVAIDDDRVAMQGTSMASPHVAGILALMLEANPTLGPEQAGRILRDSARTDGFTGAIPNAAWGWGKVDAVAAVSMLESETQQGCTALQAAAQGWMLALALLFGFCRRRLG